MVNVKKAWQRNKFLGRGGGLVVSVLAFYSDDPSSIPAEVYNFFCKIVVEKNENKQKEAGIGPFLRNKFFKTFLKHGLNPASFVYFYPFHDTMKKNYFS